MSRWIRATIPARLGTDMVSQFDLSLLDFETMRITIRRAASDAKPRR